MGIFDFIGDVFAGRAQDKMNDATIASNERINAANIAFQKRTNTQNYNRNLRAENRSRRDANHKIRTTVRDARKAGIHPLAALGSSAASVMGVPLRSDAIAPSADQTHNNLGPAGGTYIGQGLSNLQEVFAPGALEKAQIEVLATEAERNRVETALMAGRATSRTLAMNYANNPTGRSVGSDGIPTATHADVLEIGSGGGSVNMNPKRPPLERIADNYGSFVADAAGAIQFTKDWWRDRTENAQRRISNDWKEAGKNRPVNPIGTALDGLAGQANAAPVTGAGGYISPRY